MVILTFLVAFLLASFKVIEYKELSVRTLTAGTNHSKQSFENHCIYIAAEKSYSNHETLALMSMPSN